MRPDPVLLKQQARVFKALAHESRLALVTRLAQGERSVGDLAAEVGLDRTTVSKHLAVLRNCGVASDRRDGATVYYTLRTPCVMKFFECADKVLMQRV
jgi:ArsR family transcriptional regulator